MDGSEVPFSLREIPNVTVAARNRIENTRPINDRWPGIFADSARNGPGGLGSVARQKTPAIESPIVRGGVVHTRVSRHGARPGKQRRATHTQRIRVVPAAASVLRARTRANRNAAVL